MGSFPKDFLWGGAISCSQADGGFRDGGKGISTQDLRYLDPAWNHEQVEAKHHAVRSPRQSSNQALQDMGTTYYPIAAASTSITPTSRTLRCSQKWHESLSHLYLLGPLFPNGDDAQPNPEGIRYYKDLFGECKSMA